MTTLDPATPDSPATGAKIERKILKIGDVQVDLATLTAKMLQEYVDQSFEGERWAVESFDVDRKEIILWRAPATMFVAEADAESDERSISLPDTTKPSDGDRIAARLRDKHPGWEMTDFEPHLLSATMRRMSDTEVVARRVLANTLGCKPWEVKVVDVDNGFDIELPDSYAPGKHLDKLQEATETAIGRLGWIFDASPRTLRATIRAGQPPSFPAAIPFPFTDVLATDAWDYLPFGRALDGREAVWTPSVSPHCLVQGESGSGKSVVLTTLTARAVEVGFELVVIDPTKGGLDMAFAKDWCRTGGWGCESLETALAAIGLTYDEGMRRKNLLKRHGVSKWTDVPTADRPNPILVVIDEAMSLFNPRESKGMKKDDPVYIAIERQNALQGRIKDFAERIAAEMRFVGIHLVMAGQKFFASTFNAIKVNLGMRILCGAAVPDNDRRVALKNAKHTPHVPLHIVEDTSAARGVGVFEAEGTEPGVFKGYYATIGDFRSFCEQHAGPRTIRVNPDPDEVARFAPRTITTNDDEDESIGTPLAPPIRPEPG